MLKEIILDYSDKESMLKVVRALANASRINTLELLTTNSLNVIEIAERLSIPISTAALNVKILEEAGLIFTELQPGIRGSMKLCSRYCDMIHIELYPHQKKEGQNIQICGMPVGYYTDCEIQPTCGMAGKTGSIGIDDDPASFYLPQHNEAQILWFYKGYVEYRFPNKFQNPDEAVELSVSFEACSEAPFYRNDWPSDISVWMNGVLIGTWTSPGDFGGRRGRQNPPWWPDTLNQFGILKTWKVARQGTTLDGNPVSEVSIKDLSLETHPFITVRIGIGNEAENVGGVTLFGESFGDYPQNILMCFVKREDITV
jgi:predicted transcriptional regulator